MRLPTGHDLRVAYLVGLIVLLSALNFTWNQITANEVRSSAAQALRQDDHKWCAALDLITATPVSYPADPAANPSRVQSYRFYVTFVTLKHRNGCG